MATIDGQPAREHDERLHVERLVAELRDRRRGEETVYTGCLPGCDGLGHCVLKARVKNGRLVGIEPDDRYNAGLGREDRLMSDLDLIHARVQHRGCPMAWIWHHQYHDADRLLYPMKRRAGSMRGDAAFERVSWDEALDTIVAKMFECRERYGPYSMMTPFLPNQNAERLFAFWGAGVDTWGFCSFDSERLSKHLTTGYSGLGALYGSSSAADLLLNAKLVVLVGFDPTTQHHGPGHQFAWYLRMARERGTPVICLEPRYTMTAEALADQWIPIKPGTDTAFFLAVAHVLFEGNLYDEKFVAQHVEPEGFARWRRYVVGQEDGIPKTPCWAEKICAVPAQTIAEFARLYARSRPTWLYKHYAVSRKSRGENTTRAAAALQAMMGYFGLPGGILPYTIGSWPIPPAALPLGDQPAGYVVPKVCRSHKWAQAVLLLDDVRSGRLTREQWRAIVGYKADPELPIPEKFDPRMLWWGGTGQASNWLVTACDSTNDQIRALNRFDFILYMHNRMTPTARYADLVLPSIDRMWEDVSLQPSSTGGFSSLCCSPGVLPPPGEVRQVEWVFTKIASRLGFGPQYNNYYTDDQHWPEDWERYQRLSYEACVQGLEFPTADWEEFRAGQFIHVDEHRDSPFVGWRAEIAEGRPFPTASGKFEMFSPLLADETRRGAVHNDHLGRPIHHLPNDWRDLQPLPVYQPSIHGLEDSLGAKYPLMMLTSHSRYRAHSLFWGVPWLNGDVYRHGVWLNVADAEVRGVSDGDDVRVFNDKGELLLPAYVTSRIMPGVALVRQGAWYSPERGISPNVLLGDSESPVTPAPAATLVEVEKVQGGGT